MKIKALNELDTSDSSSEQSSSDDKRQQKLTKEATEEQYFEKYRLALIAIQESKESQALDMLEELNDELDVLESDCDTLKQLRFSVLKNLGNLDQEQIDHYIEALDIDSSDINLWIKTGDRSIRLNNISFGRHCFEQALEMNSKNWLAIDRLMEIYYILHLPFELFDICTRALKLNPGHRKAQALIYEAARMQPSLLADIRVDEKLHHFTSLDDIIEPLKRIKQKRRDQIEIDMQRFKRARLGLNLDTARTQSLSSLGNYIVKIYERFAKQGITSNTLIDITVNNAFSMTQQINSVNNVSANQNSNEPQTTNSQDVDMAIEGDGTSLSDTDKSNTNRNENNQPSNDDLEQTKSSSRGQKSNSIQNPKSSSLSFAAMLFPMDLGDKRRSSRNRSNQDDTFSFKMKFDELNELLPECLRIGAIEQVLQQRREEQQQQQRSDDREKELRDECLFTETTFEPTREDSMIKDIIENLTGKSRTPMNDIKLCDLMYLYLSKVASNKQNTVPEAFIKIYKIYRRLRPIPTGVFVEVGSNGVTIDEVWFSLTANEISYQPQECPFLLRILDQLRVYLDEVQHREFLVRLFLILGLNSDYRYLEVALENIEEDARVYASNRKIITRAHIKTLIDRTNEKIQQDATVETNDSLEMINKLAPKSENEMSDREINLLCTAIKSAKVWQRGLDILNQRNDLNSDVIIDTMNICMKNGAKMDAILASKLCKDAITNARPTTWTCLYRGWCGAIGVDQLEDERTLSKMNKFFELGHQFLGKKCVCTVDKGEFLMLYVKHLLGDGTDYEERDLHGALSCLFGFPSKRPAAVAGHKAQRVPILWEHSEIIYPYFEPDELPTYMSLLRKVGISGELEPVLKEIALAAPDNISPLGKVHIIEQFINAGEPIRNLDIESNDVTKNIYYLLADYYFKNKDFTRAKEYYNYDLVINPDRFDSWAASGLIRANGVDRALSGGAITTKDFVEGPFHDLVDSAIRCFEQATRLKPNEAKATLWIEFGNLTYNLVSLASRLFVYDDFEARLYNKQLGDTSKLEARHKHLYNLAKKCFKSANTLCHSEEVWLQYYMLGKIYEKVDPLLAMDYYHRADAQLFSEGATYPKKISYHNPPDLAYEAMEVHYRIHSCALKYLFNCQDLDQESMNRLKRSLLNAQRSPFVQMESVINVKTHMEQVVEKDVHLLLNDIVDDVSKEAEFDELIFMCLHGMKRCLVRCDKNFKALYRLSFYYQKIRDPRMAQNILIVKEIDTDGRISKLLARNPGVPEFQAAPPDLKGVDSLFKDRKSGNLFFNIWRIPVEEVDRPGCFEHWMFKCTTLLIETCKSLNDTNLLSIIAFQLSRQPEMSKKYLQDRARILLTRLAIQAIISIVTNAVQESEGTETQAHYLREGIMLADKFVKSNVSSDLMRDLYNRLHEKAASIRIPNTSCLPDVIMIE